MIGRIAIASGLGVCLALAGCSEGRTEAKTAPRSTRAEKLARKAAFSRAAKATKTAKTMAIARAAKARTFSFRYEVEFTPPAGSTGPVHVFVPIGESNEHQTVLNRNVTTTIPGVEAREKTYGNAVWHGQLNKNNGRPIKLTIDYKIKRKVFSRNGLASANQREHTPAERKQLARFLGSNRRVPVDGDLVSRIRKDLPRTDTTPLGRARAIYNYVLNNMEYKKVGTGWGNGDTYWACSKRYGNCTDFHALFISLARAEGIPARFEIGFPIPEDRDTGKLGGYHCWVEFHVGGIGWVPVDVSEAWKHPEKRELLFGTHPADRFQLSVGRDLKLGSGHKSGPLNYFVYPHIEVAGKRLPKSAYTTRFSYKVVE